METKAICQRRRTLRQPPIARHRRKGKYETGKDMASFVWRICDRPARTDELPGCRLPTRMKGFIVRPDEGSKPREIQNKCVGAVVSFFTGDQSRCVFGCLTAGQAFMLGEHTYASRTIEGCISNRRSELEYCEWYLSSHASSAHLPLDW
jgi:hypothetical protein